VGLLVEVQLVKMKLLGWLLAVKFYDPSFGLDFQVVGILVCMNVYVMLCFDLSQCSLGLAWGFLKEKEGSESAKRLDGSKIEKSNEMLFLLFFRTSMHQTMIPT
jgi:hypothetical protein